MTEHVFMNTQPCDAKPLRESLDAITSDAYGSVERVKASVVLLDEDQLRFDTAGERLSNITFSAWRGKSARAAAIVTKAWNGHGLEQRSQSADDIDFRVTIE